MADEPKTVSPMEEAHGLITGPRAAAYGDATTEYEAIGMIWTGLLRGKMKDGEMIDADEALMMMATLKLRRECVVRKRDNIVDAHGYIALAGRANGHGE